MTYSIAECIDKQLLRVVFQPIGVLSTGEIQGYEALLRGPMGSALESPIALFGLAQREGCMTQLERFAGRLSISTFARTQIPGKLFLNYSAESIREISGCESNVRKFLGTVNFTLERIVIELTEQASPEPLSSLASALQLVRKAGAQFALDDYGTGNANLGLWIALQPDYIKIDRSIIDNISKSPFRLEALRHLQALADSGHTQLIAEGLETIEDLIVCRDIGITYAQGFVLGKPSEGPSVTLHDHALNAIRT